jgi:hypothetical protein
MASVLPLLASEGDAAKYGLCRISLAHSTWAGAVSGARAPGST